MCPQAGRGPTCESIGAGIPSEVQLKGRNTMKRLVLVLATVTVCSLAGGALLPRAAAAQEPICDVLPEAVREVCDFCGGTQEPAGTSRPDNVPSAPAPEPAPPSTR
jgi:hypothetical protein